ncbi:hypothetical protein FE257_008591 [Aspergillus nanangensis]|uniref:Uncharacterized protein n=1 Tax=Aspergillus nanangensis TaxID=2582783 RepID=A0AAD4CL29_ASPNN|nr:hypothetical protein FE257_008591 [Aspergillus nanangensis]
MSRKEPHRSTFDEDKTRVTGIPTHDLWSPRFLSGPALLAFTAIYGAIFVSLVVLYDQSQANDGLVATNNRLHYLWTYGPTAVFTVIMALWGQVEYQAKLLAPWQEMAGRPSPAQNSVFLDCISPWNVIVLFQSIKRRQPLVFFSIAGSLLLRLLIVISTGLFVSEVVTVSLANIPLEATREFTNGSALQAASYDYQVNRIVQSIEKWNLSSPLGTYKGFAFSPVRSSDSLNTSRVVVSIETDVFSADLVCNILMDNFTFYTTNVNQHGYPAMETSMAAQDTQNTITCSSPDSNSTTFGCPRLTLTLDGCEIPITYRTDFNRTRSDWRDMGRDGIRTNVTSSYRCLPGHPADLAVIVAFSAPRASDQRFEMDVSSLLCRPEYALRRRPVFLQNNQLTADSIFQLTTQSNKESPSLMPNVSAMDIWVQAGMTITPTLGMGNKQLNASLMKEILVQHHNNSAAQIARMFLMGDSKTSVIGNATVPRERLIVREFPVIFMETLLALLICICGIIWSLSRYDVCPQDPGSISGLATILARCPLMMDFFRDSSTTPLTVLEASSAHLSYQTLRTASNNGRSFEIVPFPPLAEPRPFSTSNTKDGRPPVWWRPLSLAITGKLMVMIPPVTLVIILEILYHYSITHDGLVGVDVTGYVKYSWTYIPALVMLGVSAAFAMLDFTAVVVQPYAVLRRAGSSTRKAMVEDLTGKFAPSAFISSARKREIAVPSTKLAVVAGFLLTIAVSGLYTADIASLQVPVELAGLDLFNTSHPLRAIGDITEESMVSNLPAYIIYDHVDYPKWTYGEFVFPHLQIAGGAKESLPSNITSLRARIPATRGVLNCTLWEPQDANITFSLTDYKVHINPTHYPRSCPISMTLGPVTEALSYYGALADYSGRTPNCPSYVMMYGSINLEGPDVALSVGHCSPYLERVDVDVTFKSPDLDIDPKQPPLEVPGTSTVVARNQSLAPVSWYGLLTSGLEGTTEDSWKFDTFFKSIIYGKMVPSPLDLAGPTKSRRLLDVTSQLYGISIAQILNFQFRIPLADTTPTQIRNGTMTHQEYRLFQSGLSTHLLVGLLLFMLACAVVAYMTMGASELLPNNPCSIAARASLLAGSKFLGPGARSSKAGWSSNHQFEMQKPLLDGQFRLGWWEGDRYGIDIEDIDVSGRHPAPYDKL